MVFNGERTIYNIKLQNSILAGLPYKTILNTTINEKLNILQEYSNKESLIYPKLNIAVFGIKIDDVDTEATRLKLVSSRHSPVDGSVFNITPLYLRKESEVDEYPPSNNLRLKRKEIIDNEIYIAYYGLLLEEPDYKEDITVISGIEDDYAYIHKLERSKDEILNPIPKNNIDMKDYDTTYVCDFLKYYIAFDKLMLRELIHAANIKYNVDEVIISEIGVCSSIEVEIDDIKENTMTQVNYYLDTDIKLEGKEFIDFYVEVGGMETIRL